MTSESKVNTHSSNFVKKNHSPDHTKTHLISHNDDLGQLDRLWPNCIEDILKFIYYGD